MEFEHSKFGKCVLSEITQKQLEDFSKASRGEPDQLMTVWRGNCVRAASEIGFLVEPKITKEDVDNANPGLIRWLADCIAQMIAEANDIDPLS